MRSAAVRTVSTSRASFTPPALPRPPACTWAFTTHTLPPSARAASTASSAVVTTLPAGTGMPWLRKTSFAWYSCRFIVSRPERVKRPLSSKTAAADQRSPARVRHRRMRCSRRRCDADRVSARSQGATVAAWSKLPASKLRPTTAIAAAPFVTPSDLAWRVIGLLNLYRLIVPLMLLSMQSVSGTRWELVVARPRLFVSACITYFTAALLLIIARRLHWSSLRIVALVNATVDALAIGFIVYASGGASSGLGILLVLPVFALTVLAGPRDALLIAAVAALVILVQQIFVGVTSAP